MAKAPTDIRSLARAHTDLAIKTLAGIAQNGESESARVSAAVALLDRGWGRAPTTLTGEDGEGAISIVVRHIIEGSGGSGAPALAPAPVRQLEHQSDG